MILLACGGRDYADISTVSRVLRDLHERAGIDVLIQGGAPGADLLCGQWATANGIHTATVPALWDFYSRAAGPKRNAAMLLLKPHLVLAFPGGRGTANMVEKAISAGIEVLSYSLNQGVNSDG